MPTSSHISVADKVALLGGNPLFAKLAPDVLAHIATYAKMRDVARGKVIFAKGDPGNALFAVCSGAVQVAAPSASGKNAVLNLIEHGQIFGEIALLDGEPRTADAVAHSDCKLLVIERRDFLPLMRDYPVIAITLIEILCGRLRRTTEHVEDLMFLELDHAPRQGADAAVERQHAGRADRRDTKRAFRDGRAVARDDQQAAWHLDARKLDQG